MYFLMLLFNAFSQLLNYTNGGEFLKVVCLTNNKHIYQSCSNCFHNIIILNVFSNCKNKHHMQIAPNLAQTHLQNQILTTKY